MAQDHRGRSPSHAREGANADPAHLERGPVDDLLEGNVASIEDARARAASLGLTLGDHHIVAIVGPSDGSANGLGEPKHRRALVAALKGRISQGFSSSVVAPTRDLRIAVIVSAGSRPRAARTASHTLAQRIEEGLSIPARSVHADFAAGVGFVEREASGIRRSYRQALDALRMTDRMRRVATYEKVMSALLFEDSPERGKEFVRLLAVPLLEHDRQSKKAKFIDSIQAYLQANGNVTRAAKALGIHPRTLSYRFEDIEKLTGCFVKHPEDLVRLKLALDALSLYPPAMGDE